MSKKLAKLRDLREAQLMTQQMLADKAEIAIGVISNAERGRGINLSSIRKIADALGVPAGELMG